MIWVPPETSEGKLQFGWRKTLSTHGCCSVYKTQTLLTCNSQFESHTIQSSKYTHPHTPTHTSMHACAHTGIHIHTFTHVHTIHAHTYVHTHTQTLIFIETSKGGLVTPQWSLKIPEWSKEVSELLKYHYIKSDIKGPGVFSLSATLESNLLCWQSNSFLPAWRAQPGTWKSSCFLPGFDTVTKNKCPTVTTPQPPAFQIQARRRPDASLFLLLFTFLYMVSYNHTECSWINSWGCSFSTQ